jgi:hypothetical protein
LEEKAGGIEGNLENQGKFLKGGDISVKLLSSISFIVSEKGGDPVKIFTTF